MDFRTPGPNVISETIEGETIIINLLTGTYYSLRGAGVDVWRLVERAATLEEIVDDLGLRYQAERTDIHAAVEAFLNELQLEELVTAADGAGTAASNGSGRQTPSDSRTEEPRAPFEAPRLEKYTDMQDIILLDPVHEVTEQGWPHAREAQSA